MSQSTISATPIDLKKTNTCLWVRLDREDALNAMNSEMTDRIDQALTDSENDPSIQSIAFTGAGRAFCVGADLKGNSVQDGLSKEAATLAFIRRYNAFLDRVEAFKKPTMAVINGMALGAGIELALTCDLIVCARSARIGDGHAKFGLIPGGGGSVRLPRRIGKPAAKMLMFTGDFVDSTEAERLGLVDKVFEDAELESGSQALLDRIGRRSPLGLAVMKQLANASDLGTVGDGVRREYEAFCSHMSSEDRAEGLRAFAEKREPNFVGK